MTMTWFSATIGVYLVLIVAILILLAAAVGPKP
jgi:hypothetical protein